MNGPDRDDIAYTLEMPEALTLLGEFCDEQQERQKD